MTSKPSRVSFVALLALVSMMTIACSGSQADSINPTAPSATTPPAPIEVGVIRGFGLNPYTGGNGGVAVEITTIPGNLLVQVFDISPASADLMIFVENQSPSRATPEQPLLLLSSTPFSISGGKGELLIPHDVSQCVGKCILFISNRTPTQVTGGPAVVSAVPPSR